jgi:undecaprenyl-diphosphatase
MRFRGPAGMELVAKERDWRTFRRRIGIALMRETISRLISRWRNAGWDEAMALLSVAAVCAGVWLFIEVAAAVEHQSHQAIEERFMRALRAPENPEILIGPRGLPEVVRDVTALGSAVVVTTLSLLVVGFLVLRQRWGRIGLIVVTVGGAYLASDLLKTQFARTRPDVVPHLADVQSESFPSGHSMVSSVVYLTLGALLAQACTRRREKIYLIATAFLLTFLIGLSRVMLGVHYPTDVLAGWSAGTAWALACWWIARWMRRRRNAGRGAGL